MNIAELKRQILHVLIGIIFLFSIIYKLITPLQLFILLVISGIFGFLSLKYKIPILDFFLEKFERKNTEFPGKGFIMFLAGTLLVLKLFPLNIALASIIILTFADPVSHFIGENFGHFKILQNKKNIEGNIAGIIVSSLLAMFFVHPCLAIAGSLTAMLFESLIIEIQKIKLDDNLIIPLIAGTIMFLIQKFLI